MTERIMTFPEWKQVMQSEDGEFYRFTDLKKMDMYQSYLYREAKRRLKGDCEMEQKPKLDLNNINVGFIITGLLGMVEDDGLTPHEAFELVDLIKSQTWHGLTDIKNGKG